MGAGTATDEKARRMAGEARDIARDTAANLTAHESTCEVKLEALRDKVDSEFTHSREAQAQLKEQITDRIKHSDIHRDETRKLIAAVDEKVDAVQSEARKYWVTGGGAIILGLCTLLGKQFGIL